MLRRTPMLHFGYHGDFLSESDRRISSSAYIISNSPPDRISNLSDTRLHSLFILVFYRQKGRRQKLPLYSLQALPVGVGVGIGNRVLKQKSYSWKQYSVCPYTRKLPARDL